MNDLAMKISHAKRRGEWAEMCFMTSAAVHGLCVSKPWGETAHYDFVVDANRRLLRVQVKSTLNSPTRNRGYLTTITTDSSYILVHDLERQLEGFAISNDARDQQAATISGGQHGQQNAFIAARAR